MSSNTPVGNKRDLHQMIMDINQACADATLDLQKTMKRQDLIEQMPHSYVIPEIEVEIAVTLTSENGFLRAIFSDKDTTSNTSRLRFKYVAVPRGQA